MNVPLSQVVKQIRERGSVPLGVVSYDVNGDKIDILLFQDVDDDEARVILSKFGLSILITEKE